MPADGTNSGPSAARGSNAATDRTQQEVVAPEIVVEANALAKSYGSVKALDEVSFQVRAGEIFGFIGADGAGKTTAFRIMAGVLAPGGGEIRVLGTTPREARPRWDTSRSHSACIWTSASMRISVTQAELREVLRGRIRGA